MRVVLDFVHWQDLFPFGIGVLVLVLVCGGYFGFSRRMEQPFNWTFFWFFMLGVVAATYIWPHTWLERHIGQFDWFTFNVLEIIAFVASSWVFLLVDAESLAPNRQSMTEPTK